MIDFASFERWSGETLSVSECEKLTTTAEKGKGTTTAATTTTTNTILMSADERFPVDINLNRKVILCKADITKLAIDAIVNPTNESLNSKNGVCFDILQAGGAALAAELAALDGGCKTGGAKVTKAGGALKCRAVIHTVGPRFNVKYLTAAENALHNCYRNTLHCLREERLRHIAFSAVHSQRKGYPPDVGAHIALRTVRRYLEHYGDAIGTVVFCMVDGEVNFSVYRSILPLYFPRTEQEFDAARSQLPADCGDEWGETQIAERQIRIDVAPIAVVAADGTGVLSKAASAAAAPAPPIVPKFGSESTVVADDDLKPSALANMTTVDDAARRSAVREKLGLPKANAQDNNNNGEESGSCSVQ
jgi:O-acetyl-ADP-ribose deacetylase (regulator of RNase III)